MIKKVTGITLSSLLLSAPAWALTVTAMDSAQNMAQALVGTGVTITNATYTGANAASGYFTGGASLGAGFFDSGIVLTTGAASNVNGSANTSPKIEADNGQAGDPALTALAGQDTYDAAILEFDFVSSGTGAYFNYFFGSDEYNEYVDQYNDVFGFFFEGNNVALIPGTSTPVSIDNVNNGDHSAYYNDNTDGPTPTSKFGTTHHKADYRCFTAHGIDYDNDTVEDKYLIDVAHNAHYKGPQPLTDILEGSYEAIKIIEKRAINEDKLGVIGFDSSMKNVTQRCIGLTNYKGPQFNTIKRIFYPGIHGFSYIADIQQRVDHLFFPRYEFNSSLLLGLRWAGYLFSKRSCSLVEAAINADESHSILFPPVKDLSKNEYTKKSVILFTDGLSNCTYTDCSLSHWSTHWESIKDDLSPIVKSYADSDIPINLMLFGRAIAPHNLLMRKSSGGCLSDYEARENDLIYTDGDPYLSPGGGSPTDKLSLSFSQLIHLWGDDITTGPNMYMLDDPYFFPNSYLNNNVSIPTKGRFAPIRPPCKHTHLGFSTRAECVKKGNQVLNNICNTYPSSTFSKNAITRLTDTSRIIAPPLTDNFGRLVCDPNCRGSKDQVKSIIREIYSFSPYMLVE